MAWPAGGMYYPAMIDIAETPYAEGSELICGHFHEGLGYRAYRSRGVGDWLMILTLSGQGRFGFDGGEICTKRYDWVLIPPGIAHDYGVASGAAQWELLWVHFRPRPHWLGLLKWPGAGGGMLSLKAGEEEAALFRQVRIVQTSGKRLADCMAMAALEMVLLALDEERGGAQPSLDPRIQKALDFIESALERPLTVGVIAGKTGLSASRLAHLFRDETGRSVQVHIEERRMLKAADLLRRTGFPVQQIAASVGIESPFYFSRRFALWSGVSPTAFRRQQR